MSETRIEWAEKVWNPITGCNPVSIGCDNCYAARMAQRLVGRCGYPADDAFRVTVHDDDRLIAPMQWQRSCRVFVNSMGDLFHEDVPIVAIARVFAVMAIARQHTYLILTKRPELMAEVLTSPKFRETILREMKGLPWDGAAWDPTNNDEWPLPNVWIGVTAENQATADSRIPLLLATPAALRFVSCEPLLGPVDLTQLPERHGDAYGDGAVYINALTGACWMRDGIEKDQAPTARLDWVIAGGETGPGARPMHPDWACGLRDQCALAGTPFFFKQWGEWAFDDTHNLEHTTAPYRRIDDHHFALRIGKKVAGRLLYGREYLEFPLRQC